MEPRQSKTLIIAILVASAVLGLAAIGITYYFYSIKDISPQTSSAGNQCACYWLPRSAPSQICSNTNITSASSVSYGTLDGTTCNAVCPAQPTGKNKVYAGTATGGSCSSFTDFCSQQGYSTVDTVNDGNSDSCYCSKDAAYKKCVVTDGVKSPDKCTNLLVADLSGETLEAPLDPKIPVEISADFKGVESSASLAFSVNSEDVTGQSTLKTSDTRSLKATFSNFGSSQTLNIQALIDSQPAEATSLSCQRTLAVGTASTASCSLSPIETSTSQIQTSGSSSEVKVTNLTVGYTNVSSTDGIQLKITIPQLNLDLTTNTIPSTYISNGVISLDQNYLYNPANFTTNTAFTAITLPSGYTDSRYSVEASVEIIVNNSSENNPICSSSKSLDVVAPNSGNTGGTGVTPADQGTGSNSGGQTLTKTSNFSVTKTGPQCVQRIAPNNVANFVVTIVNNDVSPETVMSVKDKLPLGFTYVAGSSKINGTSVSDSSFVTVTTIGNSQEIVWATSTGWTVQPGQSMTITFSAIAGANALTGTSQNEVVVTPLNTPVNPLTLRTEFVFNVAQNCAAPTTGLFDSSASKILAAFLVLLMSIAFYYSKTGSQLLNSFATSRFVTGLFKTESNTRAAIDTLKANTKESLRMVGLKATYPRKYFEEKTLKDAEKKKSDKA